MSENFLFEYAALTDVGRMREHNEDCIGVLPECGLAVLADGMGGHNAGEVASQIAVDTVREVVSRRFSTRTASFWGQQRRRLQELLIKAFREANSAILLEAALQSQLSGMGTTLVAALFDGDCLTLAHVGDSRAYRVRQGRITQLTKDHSLLQQQIDAGIISADEAASSGIRNLLTRAIGTDLAPEVEVAEFEIQDGDQYLLCSDGLTDMLSDSMLLDLISEDNAYFNLPDRLIKEANLRGGRDNISVVLISVRDGDGIPVLAA